MPNSMMYQEDSFVVLETDKPEQFFTSEELLEKLMDVLPFCQDTFPKELQKFTSLAEQAKYLRDNFCELDIAPEKYLQWYIVRLEK